MAKERRNLTNLGGRGRYLSREETRARRLLKEARYPTDFVHQKNPLAGPMVPDKRLLTLFETIQDQRVSPITGDLPLSRKAREIDRAFIEWLKAMSPKEQKEAIKGLKQLSALDAEQKLSNKINTSLKSGQTVKEMEDVFDFEEGEIDDIKKKTPKPGKKLAELSRINTAAAGKPWKRGAKEIPSSLLSPVDPSMEHLVATKGKPETFVESLPPERQARVGKGGTVDVQPFEGTSKSGRPEPPEVDKYAPTRSKVQDLDVRDHEWNQAEKSKIDDMIKKADPKTHKGVTYKIGSGVTKFNLVSSFLSPRGSKSASDPTQLRFPWDRRLLGERKIHESPKQLPKRERQIKSITFFSGPDVGAKAGNDVVSISTRSSGAPLIEYLTIEEAKSRAKELQGTKGVQTVVMGKEVGSKFVPGTAASQRGKGDPKPPQVRKGSRWVGVPQVSKASRLATKPGQRWAEIQGPLHRRPKPVASTETSSPNVKARKSKPSPPPKTRRIYKSPPQARSTLLPSYLTKMKGKKLPILLLLSLLGAGAMGIGSGERSAA